MTLTVTDLLADIEPVVRGWIEEQIGDNANSNIPGDQFEFEFTGLADGNTLYYNGTAFEWNNTATLSVFPSLGSNGRVTIGSVPAPITALHIIDTVNTTIGVLGAGQLITFDNDGTGDNYFMTSVKDDAAGDPGMLLLVQGVGGWLIGLDNSDSDALKFSSTWTDLAAGAQVIFTTDGKVAINGAIDASFNLKVHGATAIDGDLTFVGAQSITTSAGDLTIDSAGNLAIQDATFIDVTSTEALLVRKNADGGDIFTVDTSTPKVIIDANLEFTGEQTITTSAGDLILDAADDLFLSPADEVLVDRDMHSYSGARYRQYSGAGTGLRTILAGEGYVFNEASEDIDFRVESDGIAGMLWVNAGTNTVAINVRTFSSYTPSGQLEVVNAANITQMLGTSYSATATHQARFELRRSHNNTEGTLTATVDGDYLGAFIVNGVNTGSNFDDDAGRFQYIQDGNAGAARIPTQLQFMLSSTATSNQNVLTLRASSMIGIMETDPAAQLHIDQPSATGAIPVLLLDQGDVSEQLIKGSYSGADVDMIIIELDVTGAPKISWDESQNNILLNKGLAIGGVSPTNATLLSVEDGLTLKESAAPTADAGYVKLWSTTVNELFFQSGDGVTHLLHGDAFSNIWFHGASTVEVAIATQNVMTKIDSFTVVGNEDDLANVVGSSANDNLTLSAIAGGEYEVSFHASVTATGGADKEMLVALGITLATAKDITVVTDDTVTPIVITSTSHGLEDGDMVEIAGVLGNTAANGSFIVDNKTANTFEIVKLDGTATTGNGDFDEGSPTGDVTIEYPGNMIIHREVRGATLGAISATGIHILANSDVLAVYVANLDGTTNLTVAAVSFDAFRIGD